MRYTAIYADLLLHTAAELQVIAAVVPSDQVVHQEAVGQVGAVISYLTLHDRLFVPRDSQASKALVTLFVECLIDQLFIQGLVPADLLWTKTGPIPDCDEFVAVALIADDIKRAIITMDAEKISWWRARGVELAAIGATDQDERSRARQWLDVAEHVKHVIAPLFTSPTHRSLRSGRRTF